MPETLEEVLIICLLCWIWIRKIILDGYINDKSDVLTFHSFKLQRLVIAGLDDLDQLE
uniref:Uncharacterized protein n=1 Tax=Arundo donax TaxID=35708 RepID=A0A0A9H7J8_ARUDO